MNATLRWDRPVPSWTGRQIYCAAKIWRSTANCSGETNIAAFIDSSLSYARDNLFADWKLAAASLLLPVCHSQTARMA
jgi:hypothetical protein